MTQEDLNHRSDDFIDFKVLNQLPCLPFSVFVAQKNLQEKSESYLSVHSHQWLLFFYPDPSETHNKQQQKSTIPTGHLIYTPHSKQILQKNSTQHQRLFAQAIQQESDWQYHYSNSRSLLSLPTNGDGVAFFGISFQLLSVLEFIFCLFEARRHLY